MVVETRRLIAKGNEEEEEEEVLPSKTRHFVKSCPLQDCTEVIATRQSWGLAANRLLYWVTSRG